MWNDILNNPLVISAVKVMLPIAACIILAALSKRVISLIRKFITTRTPTDIDDRIIEILENNLSRIIIIIGLYLGLQNLEQALPASETERLIITYATGVLYLAAVIVLSIVAVRIVSELITWYVQKLSKHEQARLVSDFKPLIDRLLKFGIASVAVVIVLQHFGQDISTLVVSLGVGSLAIALAAQDTLANMIAGFVIMIDRPFRVGDRIILNSGEQGDVYEIGLRSTKVLDFDNKLIIMPNAEIINGKLINLSYPEPAIRVTVFVGVAYGVDVDKVKSILTRICIDHPEVLEEPEPIAQLLEFADSSLNFRVVCRVAKFRNQWRVAEELRVDVYKRFEKENIEIPFPQRVVYIKKE